MSKETPKTDPRQRTDWSSNKQTDKPWEGNPEKEHKKRRCQARPGEVARIRHTLGETTKQTIPETIFDQFPIPKDVL
jgi:hypothetical protein